MKHKFCKIIPIYFVLMVPLRYFQCMNRLGCAHQYCDDCMARMPGSDGPFRDTVRWYFSCPLDNKRTSEAKVVRTDPYGRRLVGYECCARGLITFLRSFSRKLGVFIAWVFRFSIGFHSKLLILAPWTKHVLRSSSNMCFFADKTRVWMGSSIWFLLTNLCRKKRFRFGL